MTDTSITRSVVDKASLPEWFPTHEIASPFWEILGRAVGTFGALEVVLVNTIFTPTRTRTFEESDAEAALQRWLETLERTLTDPIGPLIESFRRTVREHPNATIDNLDDLLRDLREAARIRNVLCHGSWQSPDEQGRSKPLFVDKHLRVFDTAVDVAFLQQVQRGTAALICDVISTVTHMGYQFPGSDGPGKPVA